MMTENTEIQVLEDAVGVARAGADLFACTASRTVAERGDCKVALSGGSTPKLLHQTLASPGHREQIPWDRISFFWGDERAVPADHPESNFRMAQETLFSHVPVPAGQIHRIQAEEGAQEAANAYERSLQKVFGISGEEKRAGILPVFDLILLGIGTDGHTASLFPGTDALAEDRRWAAANPVPALQIQRITLTFPVLNAARRVVFLVTGAGKSKILAQILQPDPVAQPLPAQSVKPTSGLVTWLVDSNAAALLNM